MTAIINPPAPVQPLTSTIAVNLLPREVRTARKGRRTRRTVAIALAVLVVLLAGLAVMARSQVGAAQADLDAAQAQTAALQAQQRQYAEVVTMQGQAAAVAGQLAGATASDIAWAPVISAIRTALPSGATIAGISASNAASTATGGAAAPAPAPAPAAGGASGTGASGGAVANLGNVPASGAVTLTGTADQQSTVAAFVDALAGNVMFRDVVATSVDGNQGVGGYTFTVTAGLTSVVVGSRYAPTGGK